MPNEKETTIACQPQKWNKSTILVLIQTNGVGYMSQNKSTYVKVDVY